LGSPLFGHPQPSCTRGSQLFGAPPPFVASDTEAVWDLAEHRSVSIEHRPEHAGHVRHTIFVDDVDALVVQIADRGVQPTGT
jgi:hypothetical protein